MKKCLYLFYYVPNIILDLPKVQMHFERRIKRCLSDTAAAMYAEQMCNKFWLAAFQCGTTPCLSRRYNNATRRLLLLLQFAKIKENVCEYLIFIYRQCSAQWVLHASLASLFAATIDKFNYAIQAVIENADETLPGGVAAPLFFGTVAWASNIAYGDQQSGSSRLP